MNNKNTITLFLISLLSLSSHSVFAEVTAEQAARLGNDLTPLGAEKAGNADGSIPSWDGGIQTPPLDYKVGDHHPDPFENEQPLFKIDQGSVSQYADKLTEGQKALIKTYPDSFFMNVYPTHRTASFPQHYYDATKNIATTAKLTNNGSGIAGAAIGIPFPIPTSGEEVIWNHILRYRGEVASRDNGQVAPTRGGSFTMVRLEEEFNVVYSKADATEESLNNIVLYFKQTVKAPARLAGGILLVHETMDQVKEPRQAWLYNAGQRRVRRAPNVAYDNPGTASDGMRTSDQLDMFNGALDRYDWKLVGKKEMYVPYNSYKLHSDQLKYEDIVTPLHINQEHTRYELHRVWVVEANLKEGERHLFKRRTFYVDEDSWQILAVDQYDNRDQLWRVSQAHVINYYEVPTLWSTLEVHTDLQAGRYLALGLDNESDMYDFDLKRDLSDFSPAALRRAGRR